MMKRSMMKKMSLWLKLWVVREISKLMRMSMEKRFKKIMKWKVIKKRE